MTLNLLALKRLCATCSREFEGDQADSGFCSRRCYWDRPRREFRELVFEKVSPEPNTGCWLWMGRLDRYGYGHTKRPDRGDALAHRAVFSLLGGELLPGLQMDHLCRVRCCVNPAHLEQVTPAVNTSRSRSASTLCAERTECIRGHPFSGGNVRRIGNRRECRACERIRAGARRASARLSPGPKSEPEAE